MEKVISYRYGNDNYELSASEFHVTEDWEISADDVEVLVNGAKPEKYGETWSGTKVTPDMLLYSAITAYVNGTMPTEMTCTFASGELDALKSRVFQGSGIQVCGREISRRYLDIQFGQGTFLSLEMLYATEDFSRVFYVADDGDNYIAINSRRGVVTMNDELYLSLAVDSYEHALAGDGQVLFIGTVTNPGAGE